MHSSWIEDLLLIRFWCYVQGAFCDITFVLYAWWCRKSINYTNYYWPEIFHPSNQTFGSSHSHLQAWVEEDSKFKYKQKHKWRKLSNHIIINLPLQAYKLLRKSLQTNNVFEFCATPLMGWRCRISKWGVHLQRS